MGSARTQGLGDSAGDVPNLLVTYRGLCAGRSRTGCFRSCCRGRAAGLAAGSVVSVLLPRTRKKRGTGQDADYFS